MKQNGPKREVIAPGTRFGHWTFLERDADVRYCKARCDCGTEKRVQIGGMKRGDSTNCGCERGRIVRDYRPERRTDVQPWQIFNSWKLLEEVEKQNGNRRWRVRCECGTIALRPLSRIVLGKSKHCGCKGKAPSRSRFIRNAEITRFHQLHGKECATCFERKPLDQFWKAGVGATSADGHQHSCIECMSAQSAERYLKRKGRDRKLTKAERDARNIKLPEQIGMTYHRLTITEELPRRKGRRFMRCSCECGGTVDTLLAALRSGNTKSCGCLMVENIENVRSRHPKLGLKNHKTKVCKTCNKEKSIENFGRYKSGGRKAHCMSCSIQSNDEKQQMFKRDGEQFAAAVYLPGEARPPWAG